MHWIAPSEKDTASGTLEKRLWEAADQLRANSGLTSAQYSQPVLGLIFLRFAEVRFAAQRAKLEKSSASSRRGSRLDDPAAYHAEGVLYLTPNARFDHLLALPEGADVGKTVNEAMRDIEKHNPQLAAVLPKTYNIFSSTLLKQLLKKVSEIPASLDYDAFGRIYEYFLGEFARTEGQRGGEFYTPTSIVRFLVEVLEPYHGRILDPACGSGGMFVQSARFVAEHKKNPAAELSIHGQEKVAETAKLCRMNLAVHGLEAVNRLLDESVAAEAFRIRDRNEKYGRGGIDLSKIDFEKLAKRFEESKTKNIELEQLKAAIRSQLNRLVQLNRTRADFLGKFEALIESYNAGSRNIEELFRELVALSRSLSDEQERHVRENLTEEELTVFDILTRPGPGLTTEEREEVKKVTKDLLRRLKSLLVLDWRQRVGSRASVRQAIENHLDDGLPRAYTPELYQTKASAVFEHVFESYPGEGASVYTM